MTTTNEQASGSPWWRHPLMWLVFGGPAAVVVAGFATWWIAAHGADPVVAPDYYRQGVEINRRLAAKAQLPAQVGRNHATTPADDLPLPEPVR